MYKSQAVGATTNVTSRLCSAAKPDQVLVSEATVRALKNPEHWPLGEATTISLRGMSDTFVVHELRWNESDAPSLSRLRLDTSPETRAHEQTGDRSGSVANDQSDFTPFARR